MLKASIRSMITGLFLILCSSLTLADSSGVKPATENPAPPNAYMLVTGTVSQINITTYDMSPYYIYYNTNQKICPSNMFASAFISVTLAGTEDGTPVSEFAAFPVDPVITPTLLTLNTTNAWGDQGYRIYGYGYYQTLSLQLIAATAKKRYLSITYTIYCNPTT